jgi:hypothetical protein
MKHLLLAHASVAREQMGRTATRPLAAGQSTPAESAKEKSADVSSPTQSAPPPFAILGPQFAGSGYFHGGLNE